MKIVVDTNIIFSGILKTESKIGQLLTNSKNYFDFYTVDYALVEIERHKDKICSITKYTDPEYRKVIGLITKKIKYINESVIPENILSKATSLVEDFDLDDSYFVALSLHLKAKLWTGDKILISNLFKKDIRNCITSDQLYYKFLLKEQRRNLL